jgi:septal ring factor EnvC (AmiA/AmiB activator)
MIKTTREENRELTNEYNEQCDLLKKYQKKKNTLMKKILALKKNNKNLKSFIRFLKKQIENLKIEKSNEYVRNAFESSSSSYNAFDSCAKMIADINATNRFEKTKRSTTIFDSTVFIDDKNKFEH